jgi:hypothetical protein
MPAEPVSGELVRVRTLRLSLAVVAVAALIALAAAVALAAPGSLGRAASPKSGAATAVYCPPGLKRRLTATIPAYRKRMLTDRARYFRAHRSKKQRASFVRLQSKQLATLQKKLRRCS